MISMTLVYLKILLSASVCLLDFDSLDIPQLDSLTFVAAAMNRLKRHLDLTFSFFLHLNSYGFFLDRKSLKIDYLEYKDLSLRSNEGMSDEGAAACATKLHDTKKLEEVGSNYLFLSILLIFTG
ncbi:hypothetical protein BT93_L0276 [Corymbia citriodora subsp. variegata]|uniref:Uncharacterized protein n=1 Tax=Corymbia citriodora subsp. variegata TaxID=360336 RepID=A0A8T0CQB4_CORYI|nr:hypothetical protein BT93_L0276 [Corymbia citriodora subsp. variegata]